MNLVTYTLTKTELFGTRNILGKQDEIEGGQKESYRWDYNRKERKKKEKSKKRKKEWKNLMTKQF